jgi:serine/threonine protein kinase
MAEVRKLGPYVIKETLGEGGFSKVKLGVHEKTGEKVALKILKNKSKMTKHVQKQVEREIAAMTKLDHRNILRMKEVDWDATYVKKNGKEVKIILVVLELATGGELFEFLSYSGCFEESVARTYFQQLIAGLEYCHEKGVVHRDLKPENLLLNEDFVLKLADFGFSSLVAAASSGPDGSKLMFTECGTPGYMAPEMFKNKGYEGFPADIWACGVILFIMLAGFPPFQKPTESDWWYNKLANNKHALFWQAHSRSAYFSDQTKDFINKILEPVAAKRISIADMKKHPWFKGPTVTPAALVAELQRRKNTVDQLKEREKERKRQEAGELGDEPRMRSVGAVAADDDDALPPSPPKLTFKNYVFKEPTPGAAVVGFAEGLFGAAGAVEEKAVRAEPKPLPEAVRYTRFDSKVSPSQILERLVEVITSNDGKSSEGKDSYKVKAEFQSPAIKFVAEVFAHPSSAGVYVVDFRKKEGEAVAFRELYQDLRAQLADVVLQPKGVAPSAPAEAEAEAESAPAAEPAAAPAPVAAEAAGSA